MIQRIQTLYLVLGAAALAYVLLGGSLWQGATANAFAWYTPTVVVLGSIAALGALVGIFLYKDRAMQRKVVVGVQSMAVVFILVLFLGLYLAGALPRVASSNWQGLLPLILPVLAYAFFYLARRGIEHDIKLIRSMDRLR